MSARRVDDPVELAVLFGRDRATHVYGLADLDEPLWSRSRWWRDGDAAVGVLALDADSTAFYAVSPAAPDATLRLLAQLAGELPVGTEGTGEIGCAAALAGAVTDVEDLGTFTRHVLAPGALTDPPAVPGVEVVELGPDDAAALTDLHVRAGGGVFFRAAMLVDGVHVGVREDGRLVAAAGTHVRSRTHRVAAIGAVATDVAARGRGLGALATHAVASRLVAQGVTVGLNVHDDNVVADRLYRRLGFVPVHRHQEARVVAPHPGRS